jgi:multidrug efflux pump
MVLSMNIDFIHRTISFGAPSTQWWTQLASAIAGGLSFATVLTLVLTPCLLVFGDTVGVNLAIFSRRWRRSGESPVAGSG